jgi:hypothetical protein
MPEVTDAEMVQIARGISPVLADVLQRLVQEKDDRLVSLHDRLAGLASSWKAAMYHDGSGFDRGLDFCTRTLRDVLAGRDLPAEPPHDRQGPLEFIFTLEVRVDADSEADARSKLDARLPLAYTEHGCRLSRPPRAEPPMILGDDSTDLVPGERYELVHAGDLKPGDEIYLMAQRRTVLDKPWHPEEMRPELVRIPVSDRSSSITSMGPPFERDHLVPRRLPETM